MECEFFDDAIDHFDAALKLDSRGWVAMEGLAKCYGGRSEYLKAIDWMQKAVQSVKTIPGLESVCMRTRIAAWHQQLGNVSQAADSAGEACSASKEFCHGAGTASDNRILLAAKSYIGALLAMETFAKLGDLILELDSHPTNCRVSLLEFLLQVQYYFSDGGGLDGFMTRLDPSHILRMKTTLRTQFELLSSNRALAMKMMLTLASPKTIPCTETGFVCKLQDGISAGLRP